MSAPAVCLLRTLLVGVAFSSSVAIASGDGASEFLGALDRLREARDIPGLSVAVLRDQEVVLAAGLGVADLVTGRPATADTPYDAASVSKPLSAVVALKLAEEGILDLDAPMAEYSAWTDFCAGFSRQPSFFARDLRCEPATHTLRHLLSHSAVSEPGDAFSYNPMLYSWASRPIMSAAGASFSDLVAEYVFEPAGMRNSARKHRALALPPALAARMAPPHRLVEGVAVRAPDLPAQGDGAAGGVVTTVLDLARFDVAFDRDELVPAIARTEMTTPTRANDGGALPYGVGWYVQTHEGRTLLWHSGWWEEAYSALYLKIPEEGLTLILLANSEGIWWGNPLAEAAVQRSEFARLFFEHFLN